MSELRAEDERHLRHYADLDAFFIFKSIHVQPGLIHYFDSEGRVYILMNDDDDRVERCIALLESRGCPVFDDIQAMDDYIEKRASKPK